MKQQFLIIITLIMAVCLQMPISQNEASATSVMTLSDEQLVDFSDYILHVTILQTEPFQYDDHTILTRVTVKVHEQFKAPEGTSIPKVFEFYTRGGTSGDLIQTVPGEYTPVSGTECIVFLEKIRRYEDAPMLLGLTQGVFTIDEIPMTRMDRKIAKHAYRQSSFIPSAHHSDFDNSQDLNELSGKIQKAVQSRHKELKDE